MTEQTSAFWTGSLACAVAWYLATGERKHLLETYRAYMKQASPPVRAHLEAIYDGKGKR